MTTHGDFHLKDETDIYVLIFSKGVSSHTGVVRDWNYVAGKPVATFDRTRSEKECFKQYSGGWWYGNNCHDVYFTGTYL